MNDFFDCNTGNTSRRQAITDVIESIAMEEKSIAKILCAEAKKIDAVVCVPKPCASEMRSINESVCDCVKNIVKLQILLEFKLEEVKEMINDSDY